MTRLSLYARDEATEDRVTRIWNSLDHRFARDERRRPWRRGLLVLATCFAAGLLLVAGAQFAQPAQAPAIQVLALGDGSRVTHALGDGLEIESVSRERVEVRMSRGRATFSVTPSKSREFVTHAVGYTVRVLGTEFGVDLSGGGVRVEVSRGLVEVRRDATSDVWRVRAGEAWSSTAAPAARVVPSPAAPHPHSMPASVAPASVMPAPAAPPPPAWSAPPPVALDDGAGAPRMGARPAGPARKAPPRTAASPESTPPADEAKNSGPAELFQRAQDARRAGRGPEAAQLLGELLRRFPRDPHAGLSAFELGRLQLDLGDPEAALVAFDRARSAGYALAEQVEVRRVEALEAAGDLPACRVARANFLSRFPDGALSAIVRRRCP